MFGTLMWSLHHFLPLGLCVSALHPGSDIIIYNLFLIYLYIFLNIHSDVGHVQ